MANLAEWIDDSTSNLRKALSGLTEAVTQVSWALDDLKSGASKLPVPAPDDQSLDLCYREYAARSVLPHHVPAILDNVEKAQLALRSIMEHVKPLPKLEEKK